MVVRLCLKPLNRFWSRLIVQTKRPHDPLSWVLHLISGRRRRRCHCGPLAKSFHGEKTKKVNAKFKPQHNRPTFKIIVKKISTKQPNKLQHSMNGATAWTHHLTRMDWMTHKLCMCCFRLSGATAGASSIRRGRGDCMHRWHGMHEMTHTPIIHTHTCQIHSLLFCCNITLSAAAACQPCLSR